MEKLYSEELETYDRDTTDKYMLIGFLKSIRNDNSIHIKSYAKDVGIMCFKIFCRHRRIS